MIWYALAVGVLIYFFEIVGRYVLSILKIDKFKCCFGIGLIVFLAYSYITTFLITSSNGSFYVVSVIYALFFIISLVLIIKDRNKIDFKIDLAHALIMLISVFIMSLYAYNTTLGELDGFDSSFYLNFVTSNIKSNPMNYSYYSSSINQTFIDKTYSFQTFYYVASFLSYLFSNFISIFHKTYYQTTYIWVFQILFNAFYYSLIINAIDLMKNKNKIIKIFIYLFFILVYGRIYYYNIFGFYGNTYRIIAVGYSTILLYLLTKNDKNNNLLLLFMISLLASASVSSSSLFIDVFILFGSYFILCNKYKDILKYYSFPLLFILVDLLVLFLDFNILFSILLSLIISVILFIFGRQINSILSNKRILYIILAISIAFMFVASFLTTKNLFDFSTFFHNHSESADMTINYFNLNPHNNLLYLKIFILILLVLSLFSIKKELFIQFTLILFLCLFNPFCCSFLYKVLIVYFRAFDIIVNPFTIVFYIDLLLGYIQDKLVFKIALYVSICIVFLQNNPLRPMYYHESFKPGHDADAVNYTNYNNEFKMSQDEKETIDAIYEDVNYYELFNPYIITPSKLMKGFITNGRYLYNRQGDIKQYKTESEKQLFAIFLPERYLGDYIEGIVPDYDNIDKYIKEAEIDYLVVDKTKEYYDSNINLYTFLYLKVSNLYYSMFENDRYIVYRCFDQ